MSTSQKLFCRCPQFTFVHQGLVSVAMFLVVFGASSAAAVPVIQTVPGTIVLVQSFRFTPEDKQCAAHIFGQWAHVPGVQVYATAKYKANGEAETKSAYPNYSNDGRPESAAVAGYNAVPDGFDRILLASSGGSGGTSNREEYQALCNELGANLLAAFSSPTTVDVAIDQPVLTPTAVPTVNTTEIALDLIFLTKTDLKKAQTTLPAKPSKSLPKKKQEAINNKRKAISAARKSLKSKVTQLVSLQKTSGSTIRLNGFTSENLKSLNSTLKMATKLQTKSLWASVQKLLTKISS